MLLVGVNLYDKNNGFFNSISIEQASRSLSNNDILKKPDTGSLGDLWPLFSKSMSKSCLDGI